MLDEIPTELFHNVFQYLTTCDVFYAFKGLSKRVDAVLAKYDKYDFDFRSWSKSKFDFFCQSISSDQMRSLVLADADDTCRQIPTFFRLFYIRHFVNLRFLSLLEISERDLQKLISEFQFCPKLSSLKIRLAEGFIPNIVGLSLKHLSVGVCTMNVLQEILSHMPSLVDLSVRLVAGEVPVNNSLLIATEIRRLKIELPEKSNIDYDHIGILLRCMSKLEEFTFLAVKGYRFIHGNRWKDLIRQCSPQLKRFHFKVHPNLNNLNINQLLSTFRTSFWLNEKQWIIYCDHHDLPYDVHWRQNTKKVHLYTLPYSDEQFYLSLSTTGLGEVMKDKYHNVRNLYLSHAYSSNTKITNRYYFPHLHSLTIQNLHKLMPMDDFIDLSQLKHLTIEPHNSIDADEFYSYILVYATSIQSIELSWDTLVKITRNFTDERICSLLIKQIKYLNLLNMKTSDDESNEKPMKILIEIFGQSLEKLNFSVRSIDDILIVLNQMEKLYSLEIECNAFDKRMITEELTQNVPRLKNFTHRIRTISETRVCLWLWINCK